METNIKRSVQKISFSSVLILFAFVFFSFNESNTISQTYTIDLVKGEQKTIKITKDTTLEELEKIKRQMTEEGLGFEYSDIVYNDNSEIISITIGYKDKSNNSGKYSVSSKNPINDIIIVSDNNHISIKSTGNSNQAFISQGNSSQILDNNENSFDARSAAMKQRMAQMEKDMAERRTEMKERMQRRRDSLQMLNNHSQINSTSNGSSNLITKKTTDSELLELQKKYDAEGVSFSYNKLERNERNEITRISITIDNRNGSVSKSSFGNGQDIIKNIAISVDKQHTIMKSVE